MNYAAFICYRNYCKYEFPWKLDMNGFSRYSYSLETQDFDTWVSELGRPSPLNITLLSLAITVVHIYVQYLMYSIIWCILGILLSENNFRNVWIFESSALRIISKVTS